MKNKKENNTASTTIKDIDLSALSDSELTELLSKAKQVKKAKSEVLENANITFNENRINIEVDTSQTFGENKHGTSEYIVKGKYMGMYDLGNGYFINLVITRQKETAK